MDREHVPGKGVTFYEMPGIIGLSDRTLGRSIVFRTEIAESYVIDSRGERLRRLDIHYNHAKPKRK